MWLLRRGSAHWKSKNVYIVDGLQASALFMLVDPAAASTISASPSTWLSLETFGDRDKKHSVGNGHVSEANGTLPIQFTSGSTGQSPVVVSE